MPVVYVCVFYVWVFFMAVSVFYVWVFVLCLGMFYAWVVCTSEYVLCLVLLQVCVCCMLGYLFYGDWGHQPNLFKNIFGTTINHFFSYIFVSLLGFFLY